jgi:hypothetical protein
VHRTEAITHFTKLILALLNRILLFIEKCSFLCQTNSLRKLRNVLTLAAITLFVMLSMCLNGLAQQPSNFSIGSEDFANSHVYSLLRHSENIL